MLALNSLRSSHRLTDNLGSSTDALLHSEVLASCRLLGEDSETIQTTSMRRWSVFPFRSVMRLWLIDCVTTTDDLGSFKELAMQLAEDLHDVLLTDQVRLSLSALTCQHSWSLLCIGSLRWRWQSQAHVVTQGTYHDESSQSEQTFSFLTPLV